MKKFRENCLFFAFFCRLFNLQYKELADLIKLIKKELKKEDEEKKGLMFYKPVNYNFRRCWKTLFNIKKKNLKKND